jgi:hypothetical protein
LQPQGGKEQVRGARLRGGAGQGSSERGAAAGAVEVVGDLRERPERVGALPVEVGRDHHRLAERGEERSEAVRQEARLDRLRARQRHDAQPRLPRREVAQVARRDAALCEGGGLGAAQRGREPEVAVRRRTRALHAQRGEVSLEERQRVVDRWHERVAEQGVRMAGRIPRQPPRRLPDGRIVLGGGEVDGSAGHRRGARRARHEQDLRACFPRRQCRAGPGEAASDDHHVGAQRHGLPPPRRRPPVV